MWFGTYDGLNRYDGYEFKVFRNRFSDTTSLPHNRATNSFEHYRCINEFTGEENSKVVILYHDVDRNLWATTFINGKLYRLNRAANKFEVFNQDFGDLISMVEALALFSYVYAAAIKLLIVNKFLICQLNKMHSN